MTERADDALPVPFEDPSAEGRSVGIEAVVGRIVEGRWVVAMSVGVDEMTFPVVMSVGVGEISVVVGEGWVAVLAGGEVTPESEGERHAGAPEESR